MFVPLAVQIDSPTGSQDGDSGTWESLPPPLVSSLNVWDYSDGGVGQMPIRACECPITNQPTSLSAVQGLSIAFAQKLVPPESLLLHRGPSVQVSGWSPCLWGSSAAVSLSDNINKHDDQQTEAEHQQN